MIPSATINKPFSRLRLHDLPKRRGLIRRQHFDARNKSPIRGHRFAF
jgi:hypothetical protein